MRVNFIKAKGETSELLQITVSQTHTRCVNCTNTEGLAVAKCIGHKSTGCLPRLEDV